MTAPHRICYDKILPRDLLRAYELQPVPGSAQSARQIGAQAIMPRGKKWPVGSILHVRFLEGTAQQREIVQRFAPRWCEFANLSFAFDDDPRAELRITFDENDGAWSYVGTDCRDIPLHAATMNLGWQDEGVILHEFGHAIGLAHEHQNPQGGIEWNEEVVIRDLSGPPNFWSPEITRHNVLRKYSFDQINGTEFDPESIMLYAFPATWTVNGIATEANETLSRVDQDFIASRAAYPGKQEPAIEASTLQVTQVAAQPGRIEQPGALNLYRFQADKEATYTIETEGSTDLVMKLFGPDSPTSLLAEDDDSGAGTNPRIAVDLVPGTYFLQVRHYDPSSTGDYSVRVLC